MKILWNEAVKIAFYPKKSSRLLRIITFFSCLSAIFVFMIIGFIQADLENKFKDMPENIIVNHENKSFSFHDYSLLESKMIDSSKLLSEVLKSEIQWDIAIPSTVELIINGKREAISIIFTNHIEEYLRTAANVSLVMNMKESYGQNYIVIPADLNQKWFGGNNLSYKNIQICDNNREIIMEAEVAGVFDAQMNRSLIFDSLSSQEITNNFYNDMIFANLNLFHLLNSQKKNPQSFSPIEIYQSQKKIQYQQIEEINYVLKNAQYKVYNINMLKSHLNPFYNLIYQTIAIFIIVSICTCIGTMILRNKELESYLLIRKIFYARNYDIFLLIVLSNLITLLIGIIGSGIIGLVVYFISLITTGLKIKFFASLFVGCGVLVTFSFLISLIFALYYRPSYILKNFREK